MMKGHRPFSALPPVVQRYVLAVWTLSATGLAVVLMQSPVAEAHWPAAAIFAGAIALGHLVHTPTREQSNVLSGPFILTASLVLPPHQMVVAIGLGLLPGELHSSSAWYKKAFNYAVYLGDGLIASSVFRALAPADTLLSARALPAALVAAVLYSLVNVIAVLLVVSLSDGSPLRALLIPTDIMANLAIDGSGLAMAALWQVSPWLLVMGTIPLAAGAYALWMPQLIEELRLDPKIGVYNARYAVDTLYRLIREHRQEQAPLSVVMADLDNLRELNNRHGHLMGDRALQVFSDLLKEEVPRGGCVARFGGEEFLVLLPGLAGDEAALFADRVRQRIRVIRIRNEQTTQDAGITVSFGVAMLCNADQGVHDLVHRADEALYQAKRTGRDRVVIAGGSHAAPAVEIPRRLVEV